MCTKYGWTLNDCPFCFVYISISKCVAREVVVDAHAPASLICCFDGGTHASLYPRTRCALQYTESHSNKRKARRKGSCGEVEQKQMRGGRTKSEYRQPLPFLRTQNTQPPSSRLSSCAWNVPSSRSAGVALVCGDVGDVCWDRVEAKAAEHLLGLGVDFEWGNGRVEGRDLWNVLVLGGGKRGRESQY